MSSITTIDESLASELRADVSGRVVTPDDEAYHDVRAVWNGRIDRFPAAFVQVGSTDDVATAIRFAREHEFPISVRGGGHHVTGSDVADGSLVVDLSELTAVDLDAASRRVRVGNV